MYPAWVSGANLILPNLSGTNANGGYFLRSASSTRGVGTFQDDAMQPITGAVSHISESFSSYGTTSGAFTKYGATQNGTPNAVDVSGTGGFL